MKKVHKSIFFISLVLIAAFVCVSFFGIYTTYGEVTTTVVRGARELVYDRDLNDSGIIVLKAADTSAAALENAKNVVTHRLAALGYSDFDVRAAADGSGLIITSPFETSRASVLTSLAKLLVQPGKLEIRVGNETDSDGKPTGVSETVIADSTMIRGGKLTYESSPIYTIYGVRISLTKAGRQALKAATGEMLENGTASSISYWLDGEKIGTTSVKEVLDQSTLTINDSSQSGYSNSYERAVLLGSGPLEGSFTAADTVLATLDNAVAMQQGLLTALIIAVAAVAVLFMLLFKLSGVAAAAALVLEAGVTVAIQTALFTDVAGHIFTTAAMMAHLAVFALTVLICAVVCTKTAAGVQQKLSPAKAVLNATNGRAARLLLVYPVVFVFALVGYLLSGSTLFYGSSLYAYIGTVNDFCRIAMYAAVGGFVCQLLFRLMLKSISGVSWRSGSAFSSVVSRKVEMAPIAKSLLIAQAVILVICLVLAFVVPSRAQSFECSDGTLYAARYTDDSIKAETLTAELKALDSTLSVGYGYASSATSYCVIVSIPAESQTTGAQIKAMLDEKYAEKFTECFTVKLPGSYSGSQIRAAVVAGLAAAIAAGLLVTLTAKKRIAGLWAALSTVAAAGVTAAALAFCGLAIGHVYAASVCCAALIATGASAAASFDEDRSYVLSSAIAAVLCAALFGAAVIVTAAATQNVAIMATAIAMLAVLVLSTAYSYVAAAALNK